MSPRRILVPLDQSALAEVALPEAVQLARALQAGIVLLHVVPLIDDVIQSGTMRIAADEIWSSRCDEALKYLNQVRAGRLAGISTEVIVRPGEAADVILDVASTEHIDRIVMATHGRTGLTRWVLGSVAEKVLRATDRTVVLVRAPAAAAA
jgi:nucleotide-binding universal stress UspA family protein